MSITNYMEKIKPDYHGYQELHVHSIGSYRDAVNTVNDIFDAAERLGRNAVAITDHGNMTRLFPALKERTAREKKLLESELNKMSVDESTIKSILNSIGPFDSVRHPTEKMETWIEKYEDAFVKTAKQSVQFVPGIEMYATDGPDDHKGRRHLILYAVDWQGVKQLFKIHNLAQLNKYKDKPQVTFESLTKFAGPGTEGHGHIIATSACMAGAVAQILLKPQNVKNKIYALNEKIKEYKVSDLKASLDEFQQMKEKKENELKLARDEKSLAKKAVGKDFSSRIKKAEEKITALQNEVLFVEVGSFKEEKINTQIKQYKEKLAEYKTQERENNVLADSYPEKEKKVSLLTETIKNINEEIKKLQKEMAPFLKISAEIERLESELEKLGDVYEEAKSCALMYNSIFGYGNYYIELQNHGIPEEEYIYPLLKKIASETGIPLTCANDVHYANKEDSRKRNLISALMYNTPIESVSSKKGNDQLYFKSNEEIGKLFEDVPEAIENTSRIAERCNVFYKKEMHLPVFDTGSEDLTPIQYLENFARENILARYPDYNKWSEERKQSFEERLSYELSIIEKMGYSSYIAIVQDFIFYAKKLGGDERVGAGRGSAAGSLVCYLVKITDVDPIKYDLLFERFLNPDRVSMPDIDTDFAPSIRPDVIKYVEQKYEYKDNYDDDNIKTTVCGIYTENILCGRSAVRNVGRVTGVPLYLCDKVAKLIPSKPGMTIVKALNEDNSEIKKMYESDIQVKQLIDDALSIEGIPSHTGVHAAGIIIADKPVTEYAPMFWNEKKQEWVIQSDMVACEEDLGLLKMDFLALKNLDIIYISTKFIEKKNIRIDMNKVKMADDPNVFENIYAKGNTDGVFQFEASGITEVTKRLKPNNIFDVILLNAAYRPGPMDEIPEIIDVKQEKKKPVYIVPEMKPILENTYGSAIYQEQIMQIFNKIADFSLGEADIIRRAMSKKKLYVLTDPKTDYLGKFRKGLKSRGATDEDITNYWEKLLKFTSYAFNKSHAAAYSIVSYETAWLKYYYPAEYMAAILCYSTNKKIPLYIRNAKSNGIVVMRPDVNRSDVSFTVEGNAVVFGLGSIKTVKNSADIIVNERKKHGLFKSFKDFIERLCLVGIKKAVVEKLILSGALDSLINNRKVYVNILDEYITSCKSALKRIKSKNPEGTYEEYYEKLNANWITPIISEGDRFTKDEALEFEKEYLGYYASGHPLDDKENILLANSDVRIAEIDESMDNIRICGKIHEFQILKRNSDGKEMCKFILEDLTGDIECICFTKAYAKYKGYLEDGNIVSIIGRADVESSDNDEDESVTSRQFVVKEVGTTTEPKKVVIKADLNVYVDIIQPELEKMPKGNYSISIYDTLCHELKATTYCLANSSELKDFLQSNNIPYVGF